MSLINKTADDFIIDGTSSFNQVKINLETINYLINYHFTTLNSQHIAEMLQK